MRHHRDHGRARRASAESSFDVFEQALTGGGSHRRDWKAADHKTQQFCRQVERAISLALAGECGDDLLRELVVDGVAPAGSASQLLVRLRVPASISVADALQRLDAHAVTLRCLIAAAICRKRVPALTFICLPLEGGRT